ncbi:hypothetical protein [Flavobacterium sp. BFFFF1]|uniref:hypothetical protein n=1 Tax=Flavobacterium sp. BFFFF1 TaxID=2015557 RepID=UPI0025C3F5DC|nr:hypothetical protein [Flavobacterium sp. BFFFF1]
MNPLQNITDGPIKISKIMWQYRVIFTKNNTMGRNNPENIKKHNDKLHKAQAKAKKAAAARKEKRSAIVKKFNEKDTENNG